jgi:UDP-N-acetylmuramate dehydrogenase
MNAGAFGGEISNYLHSVEIMDMSGQIKTYYPDDIDFEYRFSTLKTDEFVLLARFDLMEEKSIIIQEKRDKASKGRKTNQPLKYRSAGSVFKNPKDNAAGYLIDQAGLKGVQVGNAEISKHHANFFINHGKARSSDITSLIRLARKTVFKKFGIKLELEVKTIGFDPSELEI